MLEPAFKEEREMKRKKIVKLPATSGMSVADALVVCAQTILVTSVLMKETDPNEAYDEWQEYKDHFLAISKTLSSILEQHGVECEKLDFVVPEGVSLGGYHIEDMDFLNKRDELPF
jgi:hypothetical protein